MNCTDARRHLDPFQDNELEVAANLEVLKHLNLCPTCAEIFETERRLREAMKASIASERASENLRRRIHEAISRPRARRWIPSLASLAAALMVGTIALVLWNPFSASGRVEAAVLADTAAAYHSVLPADAVDVSGADDSKAMVSLENWFRERGVCACLHDLKAAGYAFGAVGIVEDVNAKGKYSWTLQRTPDGRCVTHMSVPQHLVHMAGGQVMSIGGMEGRFFERGNLKVFLLRTPRVVCVFVTESAREADHVMAALMR